MPPTLAHYPRKHAMNFFNTQQETADEAHLLVNNADIQEIDDLQQDDFPETPREHLQEESNELDTDESSVSQFDLIVYLLLELRESTTSVHLQLALQVTYWSML